MAGTKRQEMSSALTSLRSSSSRRESTPSAGRHHAKVATTNVGCMSGIFQFISKYHTRRKFLTFRKKQEMQEPSSSPPGPPLPPPPKPETVTCKSRDHHQTSPTIPSIPTKITNSNSPTVVGRLMGLNDIPAITVVESAAEKRRKLLGALERCDDDLKALKRIIEEARVAQTPPRVVESEKLKDEDDEDMVVSEGPSPVSVLDHHRSPSLVAYSNRIINGQAVQQHQHIINKQPRHQIIKRKPGQEDHNASFYFPNRQTSSAITITPQSVARRSDAMQDTVSEVCKHVAQGQRREIGRMAFLLQDFIYKDLVDEIIKDLGGCYLKHHGFSSSTISLPFEACKRQLCF